MALPHLEDWRGRGLAGDAPVPKGALRRADGFFGQVAAGHPAVQVVAGQIGQVAEAVASDRLDDAAETVRSELERDLLDRREQFERVLILGVGRGHAGADHDVQEVIDVRGAEFDWLRVRHWQLVCARPEWFRPAHCVTSND